jgi:hypothetical protein
MSIGVHCTTIALAACFVAAPRAARADGAFPDSQSVLLPPDQPQTLILAATFGLVVSDDGGGTWAYACESRGTLNGRLYTQGPAPDQRLFAVSDHGAAVSADGGCSWRVAGGLFDGGIVYDVFPDPVDARHALAVAKPPGLGGELPPAQVYASDDGGLTYGRTVFVGPPTGGIAGVEIARADPRTIYVATFEPRDDALTRPGLARSTDGGASWDALDLEPMLGPSQVTIAAVGPGDARLLYLRVAGQDASGGRLERLAVSEDGGATFTTPISVPNGALTTFLARQSGVVLVAGVVDGAPVAFRSRDRGRTFEAWSPGIHPRGLGERGTTLFAAADDLADGFALGSSEDDGDTWTPRLRFGDIGSIRACVRKECLDDCGRQMSIGLFPPAVCRGPDPAPTAAPGGACASAGEPPAGPPLGPIMLVLALLIVAWARTNRRGRK